MKEIWRLSGDERVHIMPNRVVRESFCKKVRFGHGAGGMQGRLLCRPLEGFLVS